MNWFVKRLDLLKVSIVLVPIYIMSTLKEDIDADVKKLSLFKIGFENYFHFYFIIEWRVIIFNIENLNFTLSLFFNMKSKMRKENLVFPQ
jgi:hypothetical protein